MRQRESCEREFAMEGEAKEEKSVGLRLRALLDVRQLAREQCIARGREETAWSPGVPAYANCHRWWWPWSSFLRANLCSLRKAGEKSRAHAVGQTQHHPVAMFRHSVTNFVVPKYMSIFASFPPLICLSFIINRYPCQNCR